MMFSFSTYFILLNLSLSLLMKNLVLSKLHKMLTSTEDKWKIYVFSSYSDDYFYSKNTKQDIARFISNFIIMTYRRSFTLAVRYFLSLFLHTGPFIHSLIRSFGTVVPFHLISLGFFTMCLTTARARTTTNSLKKSFHFIITVVVNVLKLILFHPKIK